MALALLVRLAIPGGFMPAAAPGGLMVTICTGQGVMSASLPDGHHEDHPSRTECPYGALAAAVDIALMIPMATAMAVLRTPATVPVRKAAPAIGPPAPPPPAIGPPQTA